MIRSLQQLVKDLALTSCGEGRRAGYCAGGAGVVDADRRLLQKPRCATSASGATTSAIRRATFVSVPDLKRSIEDFLEAWNDEPQPFVWTATVDQICAKLKCCRQTLERIAPWCTAPRRRKKRKTS